MENKLKQKQIEEMAKVYCQNGFKCGENCQTNGCRVYEVCTELYNAGYRKIPEGSVVLTREEHISMLKDLAESNEKTYETAYERGSKDTAEKFAERLKQPPYKDFTEEWVADEICKELTEG